MKKDTLIEVNPHALIIGQIILTPWGKMPIDDLEFASTHYTVFCGEYKIKAMLSNWPQIVAGRIASTK